MKEIKSLTGIRFFLAIWVVLRHILHVYPGNENNYIGIHLDAVTDVLVSKGYLGVDGFFILSGFILSYNYGNRFKMIGIDEYVNFIVARIARIYPVHLFSLLVVLLIVIAKARVGYTIREDSYGMFSLMANIMLVQAWYTSKTTTWNDVSWSVSAEWAAYIVFPVVLYLLASRAKALRGFVIAFVAAFAFLVCVDALSGNHLSLPGGLVRVGPEFIIGMALYHILVAISKNGHRLPRYGGLVSLILVAAGIASDSDSLAVFGLSGLILSLSSDADVLAGPLSWRVVTFGGEISYCIYMTQRITETVFGFARFRLLGDAPPALHMLAYLVLLVAFAAVTQRFIEGPCRKVILARGRVTPNADRHGRTECRT